MSERSSFIGARALRACLLALALSAAVAARAQDPFADAIASFAPGTNAGFGEDELPDIVLGPPFGAGIAQGSLHTLSLGNGGVLVMRFDDPVICDGDGVDFTVFENAFRAAGGTGPVFVEAGIVAVSQDGVEFFEFPYDADTYAGLAGREPVLSNPPNGIDPTDPSVSGGDTFDLADVGLAWAAYVRITDPGAAIPDPGNLVPPGTSGGFDLDAIAAVHACVPGATETPTPTATAAPPATPTPTSSATLTPTSSASLTPTPEPSPTSSPTASLTSAPSASPTPSSTAASSPTTTSTIETTPTPPPSDPGDVDGSGGVDSRDLSQLIAEIFDGDGDFADAMFGGEVASFAGADATGDGRVSIADAIELLRRRSQ